MPFLPFAPLPSPALERRRDRDRRHPERETIELAKAAVTIRRGFSFVLSRATIGSWKENK